MPSRQLPHVGDGHTQVRIAEPEQIVQPAAGQQIADHYGLEDEPIDWCFGVATAAGDVEKVFGYHVVWNPGQWQDFSFIRPGMGDECMTFIKLNTDRNIKRGVSDYYPAFIWLERATESGNTAAGRQRSDDHRLCRTK